MTLPDDTEPGRVDVGVIVDASNGRALVLLSVGPFRSAFDPDAAEELAGWLYERAMVARTFIPDPDDDDPEAVG